MPWSRQGADGNEGPWWRRRLGTGETHNGSAPVWPQMEAFGSQVLPRDLSLFEDGTLRMVPVPELASLRINTAGSHFRAETPLNKSISCLPVTGRQIELNFTVDVGAVAEFGGELAAASVTVLASPDGRERTLIGCNSTHLIVNQLNSTLTPDLTPQELTKVKFFWNNAAVANHTILRAPLPPGKSRTCRGC